MRSIITYFRSLLFCLKYFNIRTAIKTPICVQSNLNIIKIKKGQIKLNSKAHYTIVIGGGGSPGLFSFKSSILLSNKATLVFKGKAVIGRGSILRVDENATLEIGENFYCNNNNYIRCSDNVTIGDNCLMGWENIINTTDGHYIYSDKLQQKNHGPIEIGNHVWITTRCSICKGVKIPSESVVAQNALVTKSINESNVLIAGIPAKVIKQQIKWKE